jgi:hypothetical protein
MDETETEQRDSEQEEQKDQENGSSEGQSDERAKAQQVEEETEKAKEKVEELEENPPEKLEDWPDDKAKYETFGGPEGEHSYEDGPEKQLGPSSLRHHEDGKITVEGEEVDDPDEYKGDPIPGGPTDSHTPASYGEPDLSDEGKPDPQGGEDKSEGQSDSDKDEQKDDEKDEDREKDEA